MKIDLTWLKAHPQESQEFYLEEWLDTNDLAGEPIKFQDKAKVRVTLTNTGRLILGPGKVETVLELECGKCLQTYTFPLQVEFHIQLYEAPGQGLKDEEDFVPIVDDEADLKPVILENIIVSLPMKRVCREDCQGLCSRCGTNLNEERCSCRDEEIDPRWAILKELL